MGIVIDDAEAVAALERLQAETGRDANTIVRDLLRDRMSRPVPVVAREAKTDEDQDMTDEECLARMREIIRKGESDEVRRAFTEEEKAEKTARIREIQRRVREKLGGETFDHADVVGYDEWGLPT